MPANFMNPYSFSSLGEKRADAKPPTKDLITGYLECSLTTLSPLFIPNTSNNKVFPGGPDEHRSYEFFSYEDLSGKLSQQQGYPPQKPIIPGSSLRGALRSVYEALSNSCLSTLTDFPLHSRVPKPRDPGLLMCCVSASGEETWTLQPATRYLVQTGNCNGAAGPKWQKAHGKMSLPGFYKDLETGAIIKFKPGSPYKNSRGINCGKQAIDFGQGQQEGVLLVGEVYSRKHFDHVFVPTPGAKSILIPKEAVERLEIVLEKYRDPTVNKARDHEGYRNYGLDLAKKGKGLPVFYFMAGTSGSEVYYLAPACISRNVYQKQLTQIAKDNGNYQPCSDPQNLCPTCALFGMVSGKQGGGALGSRVRVTDAEAEKFEFDSPQTLPPLLMPHVSSMEFYTNAAVSTFSTYDYKITYSGKTENYMLHTPGTLKLRGRKFYWHGTNNLRSSVNKTKLNSTVRPIKKGAKFTFKLYYRDVTEDELKKLIALLVLTPSLAHHLGRAKPLGWGSVRFDVKKVIQRHVQKDTDTVTYCLKERKDMLNNISLKTLFADPDNNDGLQDLLALLAYSDGKKKFEYPGYRYFSNNRVSINRPHYTEVLPAARDKDQTLKVSKARP